MQDEFSRAELLLGAEAMEKLRGSRVAVFGVGGVGGYAAEALARCGVGALDLIDNDRVSLSNINRQIIALHSTVGRLKVDATAERIADICPETKVYRHPCFFLPETAAQFDFSLYDYVIDAIDTVNMCLPVFKNMLATMQVRKDRMLNGAKGGFTNATDVADYLVKHGLPFRDAHGVVGRMVAYCIEKDTVIDALTMEEMQTFSPLIEEDIYDAISLTTCVNERRLPGGPAMETMQKVIAKYLQEEQ